MNLAFRVLLSRFNARKRAGAYCCIIITLKPSCVERNCRKLAESFGSYVHSVPRMTKRRAGPKTTAPTCRIHASFQLL